MTRLVSELGWETMTQRVRIQHLWILTFDLTPLPPPSPPNQLSPMTNDSQQPEWTGANKYPAGTPGDIFQTLACMIGPRLTRDKNFGVGRCR